MVKMKIISAVSALLLILFSLNSYAQDPNDTIKINKIRIASEPDYPPYCMITKDGKPEGFAIDLFLAAAKAVNLQVEIKIGVWEKIRKDLEDGEIDALPLVGRTPEREALYDFTLPYLSLHGAVFVREGSEIKSIKDLAEKEIIVMKGDNAEEYVRRSKITDKIITTKTFQEAFIHLAGGEYDAVITQRIVGINLLKNLDITSVVALGIPLPEFRQDFCFAVKQGNDTLLTILNEGLSIVIANGTYNEIHFKWFGPVIKEKVSWEDVLLIFLYYVVPVIVTISIIAIFILRRKVRISTSSLRNEIEEHKRAEKALNKQQKILEEMERVSKVGGWEYNVETDKVSWTKGTFAIHGLRFTDFDPSNMKADLRFYLPEERSLLEQSFLRAVNLGESYELKLKLLSADGIEKWVKTEGRAKFKDGKVIRVYGNIVDITDQKKAEDELTDLKNQLEKKIEERTAELKEKIEKLDKSQTAMLYMVEDLNSVTAELNKERQKLEISNKELEAFSYSVSHDLRAPLRAVTGFARLLGEGYSKNLDDEGKELLGDIEENTQKMAQLIDDLLQFSRLSRHELNKHKIDMKGLFAAISEEVKSSHTDIPVEFMIDNLPEALGDYSLIKQVVINLLSNAAKFSEKKKEIIIIVTGEINSEECIYCVSDRGVGFDMKYYDKIFGVFQRLHSNAEYEGTGVGLAIVNRIVMRHGGRVWAESEIGNGARFYFSLPNK